MSLLRLNIVVCVLGVIAPTLRPSALQAQTPMGAIRGTVSDSSQAVIAGATLTVLDIDSEASRTAESQDDGQYQFEGLQPGNYLIEVRSPGFTSQRYKLTLAVGDHPTVSFRLEVGSVNEVVSVQESIAGIDTTSSSIGGDVGRTQIDNLPLNGRNFLELSRTEPAVSVVSVANPGAFGNNYQRVSVSGAPYLQTRVSVDGATVTDRINGGTSQNFSQESVQEFQISSFGFDLATGTTGTGAVNIVSRRGANDYHGKGFFFYRDNSMAAYPALRRSSISPDPPFERRQSGFSVGGPVKKSNAFWFTNFEHNNQDGVFAVANNHPIFSKLDLVYPSPLNFDLFNIRFDGNLSRTQSGFLRFSLDKNNNTAPPGGGVYMPSNWHVSRSGAEQIQVGLNTLLTSRLVNDVRVAYSYLNNHLNPVTDQECTVQPLCVGADSPQIQIFDAPLFRIGLQSTVPKTMLQRTFQLVNNLTWHSGPHRLRFGGEWERLQLGSVHEFYAQPQITLWGPTDLQTAQLMPLYNALPASLKDGATALPTVKDILQLPLRSFIMGIGDPTLPGPYHHEQASRPDLVRFYAEDGWSIRRDLTLSYGLAFLYRSHIFNDDLPWPAYLKPLAGSEVPHVSRGINHFEPRLGLAWSPRNDTDTVFRAAAGLYHDAINFFYPFLERAPLGPSGNGRAIVDGALAGLSFVSTPTAFNGQDLLAMFPDFRSQIAAKFGNGQDLSVRGIEVLKQGDRLFDLNRTTPYAIHMNAGLQQRLGAGFVLTADYVSRRFLHFGGFQGAAALDRNRFNRPKVLSEDPNTGVVSFVRDPIIPLCNAAQAAALDPRDQCSTGPINVYGSDANYRYEGLHLKLDKRLSSKFQLTVSYALAKDTGFVEATQYDNSASAYGYSPDQKRNRLTVSGYYGLTKYTGGPHYLKVLLSDWSVAFISQTDSAPPLDTMLAGLDLDGDGISRTLFPGTTHNTFGAGLSESRLRELVAQYNESVEARTRRVTNPDGTTTVIRPRTPFNQVITPIVLPDHISHGDSFMTQDLRITRRINIGEARSLSLIGEVFNVFNFSNLSGYNNVLNQMNYGQPSARAGQVFGSGGPRAFQLAARFEF
jgi:hypothetical protein